MTSRERVRTALNHREPDRVPVCIGGTAAKMTESRFDRLAAHFGIRGQVAPVLVGPQLMRQDPRVLAALGSDVRYVHLRPPAGFRTRPAPGRGWSDEWGLTYWEHPETRVYELSGQPLAEATASDLDSFEWPDPRDPARVAGLRAEAAKRFTETDCALVAYRPVMLGVFEIAQQLRGMVNLLEDMALRPEFAEALFWKVQQVVKDFYFVQLEAVGEFVEWVEVLDDLGSQRGPLISPAMYRSLLKPVHADLIRSIKRHTPGMRVMYHSCGGVRAFIPDFIDNGVDILNPIQVAASGMDPAALKAEFGDRLCFLGGVDSQHTMQTTPEAVRAEVKRRLREMGPGGGYILAPSHNIGDDVPMENILAFFEAGRQHGRYPLTGNS